MFERGTLQLKIFMKGWPPREKGVVNRIKKVDTKFYIIQ